MPNDPSVDPRQTIDYPKQPAEPGTFDETGAYDAAPATAFTAQPALASDWPTIAGYEITAEIAKGGMGRVFAGRELALDREVAVKTLLPNADADRFVTESKITARLPHPGIPPVHALGTLANGSRYLVMKLIRGRTLADLLKERKSPGEGLSPWVQVFEQIAQAVGFAHAQGIIHRDLKPANVMVGAFGEVQVMDWGLAKIIRGQESGVGSQELNAKPQDERSDSWGSHATQSGTVLGTPGYMAPEQARGEAVDARADVFALGAILTVILTGKPPIAGTTVRETIEKAAAGDLADALARLDACGADNELAALAKRCLAADAPDRPADARLIAEQVAAYRAGVEARLRQAETERAAALVREAESHKRRRLRQAVAAVLVIGIIGTSFGMWSASNEAYEKDQALIREGAARKKEKERADGEAKAVVAEKLATVKEREATGVAVKRLGHIEKANQLLEAIFADVDPGLEQKGGPLLTEQLRDRLLATADKVDEEAIGDPLTVARLRNFLGKTLVNLGEGKKAVEVHKNALAAREKLLGPEHLDTITSMNNLALAYHHDGQVARALPLLEVTVARMKVNFGPDHTETLIAMSNLAEIYRVDGQRKKALPLFEETLSRMKAMLGIDHLETLAAMNNLALAYHDDGQLANAWALLEETLAKRKIKLGPDHAYTLTSLSNLAVTYQIDGQLAKALPLYEETLARRRGKLGPDHPDTLKSIALLGRAYQANGQLDKAIFLLEESWNKMKAKLGRDHPDTLTSMSYLASAYQNGGQLSKALPLLEEMLANMKAKLGPDHPDTLTKMNSLATSYLADRQMVKALPLFEEAVVNRNAKLGSDHPDTLVSMNNLAWAYLVDKQFAQAVPLFEETLAKRKAKLGPDHADTLVTLSNLAHVYCVTKKPAKAVPLFKDYVAVQRAKLGANDPRYADQLALVALELLKYDQFAAAEPILRECLTIRGKTQPDMWSTFNTKSMLGASLLGQENYQDAEPFLKDGYEGMKAGEKAIPRQARIRLVEARERLVQLYEATDRKAEAEKLRAEQRRQDGKLLDTIHDIGNELKLTGKLDADTPALIYQVRLKTRVTSSNPSPLCAKRPRKVRAFSSCLACSRSVASPSRLGRRGRSPTRSSRAR